MDRNDRRPDWIGSVGAVGYPAVMSRSATARACANIALVKYWGKRDAVLNLPAAGSLSLTLDALTTTTTVTWDERADADSMILDGKPASASDVARTSQWLDLVRAHAKMQTRATIVTRNEFPTASGLASSASGFAALAVAAAHAAGLSLDNRALSMLARQGSGSAARSIFAGLVRMHAGTHASGSDCFAEPIDSAENAFVDDLRMVIAAQPISVVSPSKRHVVTSTCQLELSGGVASTD